LAAGTALGLALAPPVVAESTALDGKREDEVQVLGAKLRVERAEGTEDCAGATELAERVVPLANRSAVPPPLEVDVAVRRDGEGFAADIEARGAKRGTRSFRSSDPSCDELEKSLVTALALLLDDSASAPVEPAATAEPNIAQEPKEATEEHPWFLAAGGGIAFGLATDPLGVGWLGVDGGTDRIGFGVAAFATPNASEALAPGAVEVRWLGGLARGCFALAGTRATVQLSTCLVGAAAALRGQAVGYEEVGTEVRPWYALGLEQTLSGSVGGGDFGWFLAFSVMVPLASESFSVAGVGTAFETPPASIWARLGASFRLK
jgi:hypothetical protein